MTFPALLYDPVSRKAKWTPNLVTLRKAAEALAPSGRRKIEINAPGTTFSSTLAALAEAGATQIEPGHGLTGTTPLHVGNGGVELVPLHRGYDSLIGIG